MSTIAQETILTPTMEMTLFTWRQEAPTQLPLLDQQTGHKHPASYYLAAFDLHISVSDLLFPVCLCLSLCLSIWLSCVSLCVSLRLSVQMLETSASLPGFADPRSYRIDILHRHEKDRLSDTQAWTDRLSDTSDLPGEGLVPNSTKWHKEIRKKKI